MYKGTIMIICDVMEKSRRDMDKVIDAMRTVREIEIIIFMHRKTIGRYAYSKECYREFCVCVW